VAHADGKLIHIEIPTGLHIKLKAAAALSQKTLKEAVIEAIEAWVDKPTQNRT
jgi:hypothetical protein